MNRGTKEGTIEEINFVKYFNSNKNKFKNYLTNFKLNCDNLWMVHVTIHPFSKLSNRNVLSRSDTYLIDSIDSNIANIIQNNEYYISDKTLENKNIKYNIVNKSGISVKLSGSNKFQILKLTPNSFYNLFGNYELGAGASLAFKFENELLLNNKLLTGWNTTPDKMIKYFHDLIDDDIEFYFNKDKCKKLQKYSQNKIKEIIDSSRDLQKIVFNGYKIYDEPYVAWYFSQNNIIEPLSYIPFKVTTGSGRSHGDYTIVLKP